MDTNKVVWISNKTSSQLRRGTVAIKHIANAKRQPLCGAKLRETWIMNGRELQHIGCSKCIRLAK